MTFTTTAQEMMTANWEMFERSEYKGDVKEWSLFIEMNGEQHSSSAAIPFKKGYWFFGKDGGDPAGVRLYEDGLKEGRAKVERLNRLLGESPRR